MVTATTVFAAVLSASPPLQPPPVAVAQDYTTQEGRRVRSASVTYPLPDGQIAEVVILADEMASGDGYLFVDGEAIAHTRYDEVGGVVTWTSPNSKASELAAVALAGLSGGAYAELEDAFTDYGPHGFPCSEFGKKVLKAGKYIVGGLIAGSAAVCCQATSGVACFACGAGGWALIEASSEGFDNYCD